MSNIDKIRQEIKELKEAYIGHANLCVGTDITDGLQLAIDIIDALPEEKPSEDLEKVASREGFDYVDNIVQESPGHRWNDHDVEFGYRDGFITGAEWQKKQMLKGALITNWNFNNGDKVRIFIVKEENK